MTTIPDIIDQDISKVFLLDRIPPKERDSLLTRIHDIIFSGIMVEVINRLSDKGINELDTLMDKKPSPEEMAVFLSERIPDLESLVMTEVVRFKQSSAKALSALA